MFNLLQEKQITRGPVIYSEKLIFLAIIRKTPGGDEEGRRQLDDIILEVKTPKPQTLDDDIERMIKEIEENNNRQGITVYTPYSNKKNPFRCIYNLTVDANQALVMLTNCFKKVLYFNPIKQIASQLLWVKCWTTCTDHQGMWIWSLQDSASWKEDELHHHLPVIVKKT